MAIINGVNMPNFSPGEFSEDPDKFAHPELLTKAQEFRNILGAKIFPSKKEGALARSYGNQTSMHYVMKVYGEHFSKAWDIFCNTHIFKAWTVALNCNLWTGVGVYFDTNGNNGKPWPMLHLDLRPKPLIWYRDKGEYFYPHLSKTFYTDLQQLFTVFPNMKESRIHREIRTRLFQSSTEFANKHNISRTTVSGWGNGKRISPGHCKLLHDLGISQDAIERPGERV
jgi:hypothetical protein